MMKMAFYDASAIGENVKEDCELMLMVVGERQYLPGTREDVGPVKCHGHWVNVK